MCRIKICGLTRKEDIKAVNYFKPDYIGFVFAPSKRQISFANALKLKTSLSDNITAVGVFVNAEIKDILNYVNAGICDMIQLHGNESEEYIIKLKSFTAAPVIKSINVIRKDDIIAKNNSSAEYLLLDKGCGGTGKCFDWNLVKYCKKPFFLAGGINISNISEAIKLNPFCIDISSGAETNQIKDEEKIAELIMYTKRFK